MIESKEYIVNQKINGISVLKIIQKDDSLILNL